MDTIKVTVASDENASRMELLVRIFWSFIVGLVLGVLGLIAGIALFIEWLHILFLGKRNPGLQKFINAYGIALTQLKFYCILATDERPPFFPEF